MSAPKHHVKLEVIKPVVVRDHTGQVVRRLAAGQRAQCSRDCGHYWETDIGRLYKYEARIVGRALRWQSH